MSSDERAMPTRFGALTDTGGRRAVNEDAVLARPPVFCVADGMGGHSRGAMASAAVVGAFEQLAQEIDDAGGTAAVSAEQVQAAVVEAQTRIRAELGLAAPESDTEMTAGSTLAGVILTRADERLCWLAFNVGDSRIYRFANGSLTRVSVDHSLVQEMIDAGEIDEEQALTHPMRNMITRAVGSGVEVSPDFWLLGAGRGDRLLLCSDGLINEVPEAEIAATLAGGGTAQQVSETLMARATFRGARDNVSVVVVDLDLSDQVDEVTAPRLAGAYDPEDTMPREYAQ
ncbi:PP2C family protein-serine/threonine phosphatase [Pseudactinotalea sp.]|uniref:PP2C family protein-serine/threonine phosphatase n=1 Tax=Pseudactinotalea sp. TaxID=1926260 RepID=UPI003B3BAE39